MIYVPGKDDPVYKSGISDDVQDNDIADCPVIGNRLVVLAVRNEKKVTWWGGWPANFGPFGEMMLDPAKSRATASSTEK